MHESPKSPGMTSLTLAIKRAMAEDARKFSRPILCDRLSALLGVNVSMAMLNDYIAESKTHRFPAAWIPAWIEVTESRTVLDLIVGATPYWIGDKEALRLMKLGRAHEAKRDAEREIEDLGGGK